VAGYYSATRQQNAAAPLADFCTAAYIYVCGPMRLLEATKAEWRKQDRAAGCLRFETFGNSGLYASEAFTVRIGQFSRTIDVPANQTMLAALEAAGIHMISDCRRGECGICAVTILEATGVVDHRDVFFSEAEHQTNAKLCACVSRVAGGTITIDTGDRQPGHPPSAGCKSTG
jgi:vanillate O-demethylase ferredoxin subunit